MELDQRPKAGDCAKIVLLVAKRKKKRASYLVQFLISIMVVIFKNVTFRTD